MSYKAVFRRARLLLASVSSGVALYVLCVFGTAYGDTALGIQRSTSPVHPVSLDDLQRIRTRVVTVDLSPDGRTLVYGINGEDEQGQSIWLIETHPGAAPHRIGTGFLPKWSPDGKRIAYYTTDSKGVQLWLYSADQRRVVRLTSVEGGIDPDPSTRIAGWTHDAFRFAWSPDSRRIVFASRVGISHEHVNASHSSPERGDTAGSGKGAPLILTNMTPPEWTLSGIFAQPFLNPAIAASKNGRNVTATNQDVLSEMRSSQLFTADADTGAVLRLTNDTSSNFHPDWSPDGRMIAFSSTGQSGPIYGKETINLHLIDPSTGKRRAVTAGPGLRYLPTWSPNGGYLGYLERESFFGQSSVFALSISDQISIPVTAALRRSVSHFRWLTDETTVVATYKDGMSRYLARIRLTAGAGEVGTPFSGSVQFPSAVTEIATSRSGSVAWVQSDSTSPGSIRYVAATGNTPVVLVDLYPEVHGLDLNPVETIRWRNSRGDELEGVLLRPRTRVGSAKPPLIVDVYPLADGSGWLDPMMGNQAWVSSGYAVFRPSPRAPHVWMNAWRDPDWSLAGKGPTGWDVMVDDVMSGIDALVDRGVADPENMALYGFSSGASVVNHLITKTTQFRCAVSVASSMSDWISPSFLNTPALPQFAMLAGETPWDNPRAYIELSAVFHANKVKTPVLLAVGDDDGGFLLGTIRMYNALRHAGVDVTLLRYPNQGHGFKGEAMADFWNREMAFFDACLRRSPSQH